MATSTITSKGQTTIPLEIRQLLNLQAGDRVEFVVRDGKVFLEPLNVAVETLSGKYHNLVVGSPLTQEEIDEAIAAAVVEEVE